MNFTQDSSEDSEEAEKRLSKRITRRKSRGPLTEQDALDEAQFKESYPDNNKKRPKGNKKKPRMSRYARDELAKEKYEDRLDEDNEKFYKNLYRSPENTDKPIRRRKSSRNRDEQGPLRETEDEFMKGLVKEQTEKNRRNRRRRRRD
ncbi:MAG TPA: hypothetical protein ENI73_05040 [Spirochaetes bacterium]|nr:hypothetical protein [Spirochaetota bacterium]